MSPDAGGGGQTVPLLGVNDPVPQATALPLLPPPLLPPVPVPVPPVPVLPPLPVVGAAFEVHATTLPPRTSTARRFPIRRFVVIKIAPFRFAFALVSPPSSRLLPAPSVLLVAVEAQMVDPELDRRLLRETEDRVRDPVGLRLLLKHGEGDGVEGPVAGHRRHRLVVVPAFVGRLGRRQRP